MGFKQANTFGLSVDYVFGKVKRATHDIGTVRRSQNVENLESDNKETLIEVVGDCKTKITHGG